MTEPGPTVPTAPPDASRLLALDDELWRRLLVHLRRSLAEAADDDPRIRRLGGLPASRLRSGRARRDAAAALAAGGPVWMDLRRRVGTDPELAAELGAALREHAPAVSPPTAPPPAPSSGVADLDRLKHRLREMQAQRDEARRRAEGEAARADREAAARAEAEAALAAADARMAELEERLDAAAGRQAAAVERERRRGQAAMAEVADQLRQVRRERQEQRRQDRADARAEQARAAAPPARRPRAPRAPRLVPGRPSRLPDTVRPGTTEAVSLLLHPGRLVLVDGYNVSRTHRSDLDLEAQRRWLLNLLAGAVATRRVDVRVVFDSHAAHGPGSARKDRGVAVVFTPEGITADDDLVFEVEALDPARPVVVVTDDRELRERLQPYRVDLVGTQGFLDALR